MIASYRQFFSLITFYWIYLSSVRFNNISLIFRNILLRMLTSSEIRGILFGDSQHLIKLTDLMDYLRTILDDTEYKVGHAQRDLELQNRAIIRIRQLLKGAIGNKKGNPYYTFL